MFTAPFIKDLIGIRRQKVYYYSQCKILDKKIINGITYYTEQSVIELIDRLYKKRRITEEKRDEAMKKIKDFLLKMLLL